MMRFWHWFAGHCWVEHSVQSFKGTNKIRWWGEIRNDQDRMETYGFTDIDFLCVCGAHKRHRLIGSRNTANDNDIAELRRMARL